MSILTGPDTNIYADTTIPGTSAVAMTEFQAGGNSVELIVTITTGGCGSLTFTAEKKVIIDGTASAYADVIDKDSVWSMASTVVDTAGTYIIPMEGLSLAPNDYCRLSYTAATKAGKVKVDLHNWENPAGGGMDISVGDVVADLGDIDVNTAATAASLASVIGTDGATGPAATMSIAGTQSTGEIEEMRVDADGHPQVDVITLPGGLTGFAEDSAHTTGDVGVECLSVRNDTLASLCDTDGDYTPPQVNAKGSTYVDVSSVSGADISATNPVFAELTDGTAVVSTSNPLSVNLTDGTSACLLSDANTARAVGNHVLSVQEIGADGTVPPTGSLLTNAPFAKITDGTTNAAVIAGTTALKTDTSSVAGTATDVDAGNVSAGSQRVTLATDDVNTAAINTATATIAGDTTSLDAKVPALGTAAMVASSPVTIASDDTLTAAANTLLGTIDADTSSLETTVGAHDAAAAAPGTRIVGRATAALSTAVDNGDDAQINTDLNQQIRLASHTISTTSDRVEEIDPLSAQYVESSVIDNQAVVTALDTYTSEIDVSGYKDVTLQVYMVGGVDAGTNDETVTITVEASNGLQIAAADRWIDITEVIVDMELGTNSHANFTSTGATAAEHLLSIGDVNVEKLRVKYVWGGAPDGATAGSIVIVARKRAL